MNVLQWQGWRAFMAHALTEPNQDPYTWVLRVREDVGYYAPVNISLAKEGIVYFKPCEGFGGISDKAWLAPPQYAGIIAQDMHAARCLFMWLRLVYTLRNARPDSVTQWLYSAGILSSTTHTRKTPKCCCGRS
jgi:hypothetical protein